MKADIRGCPTCCLAHPSPHTRSFLWSARHTILQVSDLGSLFHKFLQTHFINFLEIPLCSSLLRCLQRVRIICRLVLQTTTITPYSWAVTPLLFSWILDCILWLPALFLEAGLVSDVSALAVAQVIHLGVCKMPLKVPQQGNWCRAGSRAGSRAGCHAELAWRALMKRSHV